MTTRRSLSMPNRPFLGVFMNDSIALAQRENMTDGDLITEMIASGYYTKEEAEAIVSE
jgi:hypothetical protein